MLTIIKKYGVVLAGLAFIAASLGLLFLDNWYTFLVPAILGIVFFVFYKPDYLYFFLFFATPLSINIEEYTDSFGLFIPTEPILAGLMLLFIAHEIRKPFFPNFIWKDYLVWSVVAYLSWIFLSSLASSHPLVSFKFLLVRMWFIIPMFFYGIKFFSDLAKIKTFIWLFNIGMTIAILYTVTIHATYQFGEKESHWVMWPFFKDHTIYGAIVALVLPLNIGLYLSKKQTPLVQAILIGMIAVNLIGLYFSYTRAAWLSVVAAFFVFLCIRFKIHFKYLFGTAVLGGLIVLASWNQIEQNLAKNKHEHTTEDFGKRIQSAANISTDASNLERINRWTSALRMFAERPIFGFGPGTYAFEYARFQDPEKLTIISTNFGDGGNAHSEYLGPMAEMGIGGLLFTLLWIGCLFYKGISTYILIPNDMREIRALCMVMILALVTYFVHGFLNNYLDTDKAAVPIWAMAACFIAIENQVKQRGKAQA